MMKKGGVCGILTAVLFALSAASQAAEVTKRSGDVQTEIRLNAGRLSGDSGEYVYDAYGVSSGIPGYKVSQLNWQIDDVYLIGVGASVIPTEWLRLNFDYWSNPSDGNGTMDDYDWLYVGLDWSHWSHHENTTVTDVRSLDLNGELTLYKFVNQTTITGLLGYKQDKLGWQAVGGYGIYSNTDIGGFRDVSVTFPNVPGITYEQTFDMPYIGLALRSTSKARSTPIELYLSYRYSNKVHGEDVDTHHLRDLRFEESGDNGTWHAYDLKVAFHYSKDLTFNLAYAGQRYDEIKATTKVIDTKTGATTFYSGPAAGLDHSSNMLSLGLSHKL